jgi:acyl carrier protein
MEVEKKVKMYFKDIANIEDEEIKMEANLFDDYGLDSIKAVKIISDIEVEYDIDIDDEEAQAICTLNDVVNLIKSKSKEG